jgi:DNA repair protein RadD
VAYKLRPYQQEAADIGVKTLRTSDKPFVLMLATGAGKSLVIAEICHQLNEPVLILQPSKEILEQNYAKLKSYGVEDVSIYSASVGQKVISKFTYATIGSIKTKPEEFKHFKYVILDECHLLNPKNPSGMLTKFLKDIDCKGICGLTATPYRLSQKYFREDGQLFYTSRLQMLTRIPLK